MKTYVYIDAFNLYFGCVKGTPYKWLNLSRLCGILLPQHQIEGIKYFTAHVKSLPNSPDAPARQQIYLRALRMTTNKKKLIEGALPLEAINQASAREKSIRHGGTRARYICGGRGGR